MSRSPKQMVAIIMALKKKGLLPQITKKLRATMEARGVHPAKGPLHWEGVLGLDRPGRLKRGSFSLHGKRINLRMSEAVARDKGLVRLLSVRKAKEALSLIPESHFRQMNIKGIYVLDDLDFRDVLIKIHSAPSVPNVATQGALEIVATGQVPRITGMYQRGRLFLNSTAFKVAGIREARESGNMYRTAKEALAEGIRTEYKTTLLHEAAHGFDNPQGKVGVFKGQWRSSDPAYLKIRDVRKPWEELTQEERSKVIEDFAVDYSRYAEMGYEYRYFAPKEARYMKRLFEGK